MMNSNGMDKPLLTPYFLIALALIGLGDTFYLSYYAFLNVIPGCAISGCEIVLASVYAHPLGVPLAYMGLIYYLHVLGLMILLAINPHSFALRLGALAYTGIGLLLSLVFESIQIFIIGAICMYCAISAITTLLLFSTAVWHFQKTRARADSTI